MYHLCVYIYKENISDINYQGVSCLNIHIQSVYLLKWVFTDKTVINTDDTPYLLPDAQTTAYAEEGTDYLQYSIS